MDEQEKAELRIIEKSLQREEMVEQLKVKHGITGTREEQKEKVEEKKLEIQNAEANEQVEEAEGV